MSGTRRDEMRSEHNARCCALQQLETALSLYFEGKDYYSAITLAGAAGKIVGGSPDIFVHREHRKRLREAAQHARSRLPRAPFHSSSCTIGH